MYEKADMAQLVEQRIRNAWVTSSSLVIGSFLAQEVFSAACPRRRHAVIAQLVERRLPKPNVAGSSPVYRSSSTSTDITQSSQPTALKGCRFFFAFCWQVASVDELALLTR